MLHILWHDINPFHLESILLFIFPPGNVGTFGATAQYSTGVLNRIGYNTIECTLFIPSEKFGYPADRA